ncbi:MAG: radical SAM protein [Candidatus Thorarchaeota archaeon]
MTNNDERPIRFARTRSDGELEPPFPMDPVKLTESTRKTVCKVVDGVHLRKYTRFYAVGVYGGIATAYSVGCNYRCIFCWVDWSRDWPEKYGEFYSPFQVYTRLKEIMKVQKLKRARVSGAEPTLCPDHICSILELVHRDADAFDLFVIETNGVVIGSEEDLASKLALYASRDTETVGHVRLSIRGGLPIPFMEKTGCAATFLDLPFIAAQRLWDAGASFHVAVVVDPRFTSDKERAVIYDRLNDIHPTVRHGVEKEFLDPYPHALVRLRAVGREDVTGRVMNDKEVYARKRMPSDE